ncbi:hypothetical protein [Lacticaseibacillus porcinae]|uniref:hypothetical protein n=1 Tax=Lacticaseibacillus porcinae TaxID=1123687 RepID=UPI000F77E4DE|nr:hypothetical protein [Lacticaseibacillus porcinae]
MKKIVLVTIGILLSFSLAACRATTGPNAEDRITTVAEASKHRLTTDEHIWQTQAVATMKTSDSAFSKPKYAKQSDDTITTTNKAGMDAADKLTTYAQAKSGMLQGIKNEKAGQKLTTLAQVNQLLKAAKAPHQLTSFDQLVIYQDKVTIAKSGTGAIVMDQKLYLVPLVWSPNSTVNATVLTPAKQQRPKLTNIKALQGRWVSKTDATAQMRVSGNWLYQISPRGGVSRVQIQNLRDLSDSQLSSGQFATMSAITTQNHYLMPKATTTDAADGFSTVYLFLDAKHFAVLTTNHKPVIYTKSTAGTDTTAIPDWATAIFKTYDDRHTNITATSADPLNNGTYEVVANTYDNFSTYYALDQRQYMFATVNGDQVTLSATD